jgi:protein-disulfide isomerase
MSASPRVTLLVLALAGAAACGPRQVEVRTAPSTTTSAEQSVQVTNSLSQAVNVYVIDAATTSGANPGGELFLRQIPANTVEKVPVVNVPAGRTVYFRAVTVDGSRTYQSRNVVLSGTFLWSVP